MLAARLPGNSTYDNPPVRPDPRMPGVASFPHALYRKAGTLAPTRQARSCTSKNARGNAGSARGGEAARGSLWRTTPGRAGPSRCSGSALSP